MKKILTSVISLALIFIFTACGETPEPATDGIPEDFAFTIVWNTYGISSYDSNTGKLIKSSDTDDISKFAVDLVLSDEQRREIYEILTEDLDIGEYPATYDPFAKKDGSPGLMSEPNERIELTITSDGETHRVKCPSVALAKASECPTKRGKRFMKAIRKVTEILTTTPEWGSFPEYDHFYD